MEKFLSIHVTDVCNSKCSFCVTSSPDTRRDSVDYNSILEFLRANAGGEYRIVNLHGGEPTIHPRITDILQSIRRLEYPEVHLQTNALKLADAGFTRKLIELGVTKFIVSLHGDEPEIHDSQTGVRGGFLRTLEGIRNAKAQGALVRTNTVITKRNLVRLPQICSLACDLGVDHVNVSSLHPAGKALNIVNQIMPTYGEARDQVYRAVDTVIARNRRATVEGFPYCVLPGRMAHQLNEERRYIRMLLRGQVIEDYDQFMLDQSRFLLATCGDCAVRRKCGGVCLQYVICAGMNEFLPVLQGSRDSSVAACALLSPHKRQENQWSKEVEPAISLPAAKGFSSGE
jgi:MoaA/NifB/PqqE/SkfB family radical SAM enzyme